MSAPRYPTLAGRAAEPRSRPPLARMIRIHELMRSEKYPNCTSLAAELEISYKTAMRDIEFMRDQWRMPIEYDYFHKGFYYTAPVSSLPAMTVSQGELVALLVAQKAVEQYRGTPFERPIASAFDKLAASLDGREGVSIQRLAEAFSFKPASLAQSEMKTFAVAADAVLRSRELFFQYRSLRGAGKEARSVEPYHLGCISDQWYVIGRDPGRGAVRTFAVARMSRPRLGPRTFAVPEDFSIGEILGGSFSAFQATRTETVRLHLSPLAARLAAERKWHPSQKLRPKRGGAAELTMQVGLAPDLESWILSWGEHARVLAPASLKKKVVARLRAALAAASAS
jgi:predicted DNA-binding transcriptional regulator YafY